MRNLFLTAAIATLLGLQPARAESLNEALAAAYANNQDLNAARASTRAVDERVPQALAGYRPTITGTVTYGVTQFGGPSSNGSRTSLSTGITLVQPIFRGFRTENSVKAAEAAVKASREALRSAEQDVLFSAVEAYMNVIRDMAILDLREANVRFLNEQVRAATDRFQVGEGTRTDVAQSEASVAEASAAVSLARANLAASRANYERVIGRTPKGVKAPRPATALLPKSIESAITVSRAEHPAIQAAVHNADTAAFNVKVVEGELLPTVQLEASTSRQWDTGLGANDNVSGSVVGRVTIPLYEGGQVYSRVREAKETLGQRKIEVDGTRAQVQSALVSSWGALQAALAQIDAAASAVDANRLALEGIQEEQRVGQRTTLDVLDAQNTLINARVLQVTAERDAVVASYAVLSALGRLSKERLGLSVATYEPTQHYKQVRDKWFGLRTPDGR